MDLYLMRHGQTFFNQVGLVQGACDSPLTELGIEQARKAGEFFKDQQINFDAIYASTQERACDTAEIVSQRTDYKRLKGLKEWDFGLFEAQPEKLTPRFREGANSFEDLFVPYGGEDVRAVGERMKVALTSIAEEESGTVLAVSHGGSMWAFLLVLGVDVDSTLRFGNCAICHYRYENGSFRLVEVIDPLDN
ncbi:phosphoglycerate mutase [Streptococcus himalayensis]|uniref:Phosphoglycerate mutase n=2 Tax=Streptococcus himalayensis TaxID=1888195 RepID=A0A917A7C0_9STRE|nr:phosphoglycerate mutase [Streptococcus himalayensis]